MKHATKYGVAGAWALAVITAAGVAWMRRQPGPILIILVGAAVTATFSRQRGARRDAATYAEWMYHRGLLDGATDQLLNAAPKDAALNGRRRVSTLRVGDRKVIAGGIEGYPGTDDPKVAEQLAAIAREARYGRDAS